MTDPRSFGAWLRRERERRTIPLRAIADRTKIGVGLLEGLERGDVSRWPGGIYRRAFMRAYADTIGLDADLVIANFERVFPDPESTLLAIEPAASFPAPGDESGFRLQLAGPASPLPALRNAAREVGFALAFGLVGLIAAGALGFWCATAVSALVYRVCGILGMRHPRPVRALPAENAAAAERAQPPRQPAYTTPEWVNDFADIMPMDAAMSTTRTQQWNVQ